MTRLTAPPHLIALSRHASASLRTERARWIEESRAAGATYDQIAGALDLDQHHVRAIHLSTSADLLTRCEGYAEALLEGPLARRNWTATTRDAVAQRIVAIIKAEGASA